MSVLYCTRPGKLQYRNSRRVSESDGVNRLLAGRFGVYICIRVILFVFWKLKATVEKGESFLKFQSFALLTVQAQIRHRRTAILYVDVECE